MKNILLIATGGTIASAEDGNGLSPALTGEELARSVPQIAGLCHLDIVQPMNIDSTNMRPCDWMRIRDVIVEGYDDHDGFVVLHGTDTMSYTAAALSYLIQDSDKPIVLTGSQQPMGNPFTDAKLNLYQSLLYAIDDRSRDVSIVFGGKAIAGTRARKQRTMSFNAFISVNYPSLAYIRTDRIIRSGFLGAAASTSAHAEASGAQATRRPLVYDRIDDRVCVLKLTPGLTPRVFELLAPSYDAIILETFGMGGIPEFGADDALSYQRAIFDWVDSGRTVVMTTQVPEEGLDLGVYEVGRAYAEHPGILKGDDMTTEALVAKTMWALGQSRDAETIRELFHRPVNHDRVVAD
ncbi:MAG: asparaginase [Collinsella sp.]|nr:asparaginase [Collinsella sp.]